MAVRVDKIHQNGLNVITDHLNIGPSFYCSSIQLSSFLTPPLSAEDGNAFTI